MVIVTWFSLIASQLYLIYFLSFDSHNIYYLFKHWQIKYRKRITSFNKAVVDELSASVLCFCFKQEKRAHRWAGVYKASTCTAGLLGELSPGS